MSDIRRFLAVARLQRDKGQQGNEITSGESSSHADRRDSQEEVTSGSSNSAEEPSQKQQKVKPRGLNPPTKKVWETWCKDRPWLRRTEQLGMFCTTCVEHQTNPSVAGSGNAPNALDRGTKRYMFDTVRNHSKSHYHLHAESLSADRMQSTMDVLFFFCFLFWRFKPEDAQQIFLFFMATYSLLKRSAPLQQIREELDLFRSCGLPYNITYEDRNAATDAAKFIAAEIEQGVSKMIRTVSFGHF